MQIARPSAPTAGDSDPSENIILGKYYDDITKFPLLTREEEIALTQRKCRGDKAARDLLVASNLRFVVKLARDYDRAQAGLPLLDRIAEGNCGLIKGVERYELKYKTKLTTYASWWIKQSILRALYKQGRTIRVSEHSLNKAKALRKTISELRLDDNSPPIEDLAKIHKMAPSKVVHILDITSPLINLDAPLGTDSEQTATWGEIIADTAATDPAEQLMQRQRVGVLRMCLDKLDKQEQTILSLRFGLNGTAKTLEQVGKRFKLTRERIRQIEHYARHRLAALVREYEENLRPGTLLGQVRDPSEVRRELREEAKLALAA